MESRSRSAIESPNWMHRSKNKGIVISRSVGRSFFSFHIRLYVQYPQFYQLWQDFERKHSAELALYEAAVRYLEKLKANGEEVTPKKWQAEADRLKAEKSVQYQKMKAMREDIKAVENLKKTAEQLVRTETEPARKKEEQEL